MEQLPIGQRLKILIPALGLKVRTFAQALGVSETNVRNYTERGSKPSSDFLESIVLHFEKVNPHFLLTGTGEPLVPESNQLEDPRGAYQRNFKNSIVAGQIAGGATQNRGAASSETLIALALAEQNVENLKAQLAEKERMIQLLLSQLPKP